jgi:hypothetical protein
MKQIRMLLSIGRSAPAVAASLAEDLELCLQHTIYSNDHTRKKKKGK